MKRKILLSLASIILIATNATAQAIGSWKAHMAYSDVTWIEPPHTSSMYLRREISTPTTVTTKASKRSIKQTFSTIVEST